MSDYRICSLSVMDNIADPDISFDENGICNYYYDYQERAKHRLFTDAEHADKLPRIIEEIKGSGKGREYDCLIGVSGGVDSTYIAYKVRELGLRPLAVHFDNGWNSELAVKNIENTLNKLNIDLHTYVIDWDEFKSLQLAFLGASTPDGEIPTDHAIFALLFKVADEKGIKYIINGNNFATEFVMPPTWSYGHIDWKYIRYINRTFGTAELKGYPYITPSRYVYYSFLKRIKIISLLNYLPYNKANAMNLLKDKLEWKYYGGKHYESIYTRFYQGYVLPNKFGIDKRKAHLSTLIFSGQLNREEAIRELQNPIYPDHLFEEDRIFVLKKLKLKEDQFQQFMGMPNKTFRDYPNQSRQLANLKKMLNRLRGKGLMYS